MTPATFVSLDELAKHNTNFDCWISLHGIVFEVDLKTLEDHPGGASSILRCAGTDCTNDFEDIGHSDTAREWCEQLKVIGKLKLSDSYTKANIISNEYSKIPRVAELMEHKHLNETDALNKFDPNVASTLDPEREERKNSFRVSNIFIYPIKACAGVEVTKATVTKTGFKHDREYVLVTEEKACYDGREYHELLNPYELSALALIQPSIPTEDGIRIQLRNDGVASHVELIENEGLLPPSRNGFTKKNPMKCSIFVPRIDPQTNPNAIIRKYDHLNKCVVEGVDQGDDVANYLTDFLRLVHLDNISSVPNIRLLRYLNRKLIDVDKHQAMYAHPQAANYAPFMFTTETTMKMLNSFYIDGKQNRTETLATTIKRYRPNIVFRPAHQSLQIPFGEDSWENIQLADFPSKYLKVVKSCGRCSHIFVNPSTGKCDGEMIQKKLKTLGRDASGMMKKMESKLSLVGNHYGDIVGDKGKSDITKDEFSGNNIVSIDPVVPHFYSHYKKFVKNGRPGKLFLGICAMPSEDFTPKWGPLFHDVEEDIIHVGQKWVSIPSKNTVAQYEKEMRRKTENNFDVLQENRIIDLIPRYGRLFAETFIFYNNKNQNTTFTTDNFDPKQKSIPSVWEFFQEGTKFQKRSVKVTEVVKLTHDTKRIRLDFSHHLPFFLVKKPGMLIVSGLACGQHIKIFCDNPAFQKEQWNSQHQSDYEKRSVEIKRSFTPVKCGNGYMDLIAKIYKMDGMTHFSDGGRMTAHYLDGVCVGDEINISGPYGHIEYLGLGTFTFGATSKKTFDKIIMIAGGTGITPMWQLIQYIHAERKIMPLNKPNLPQIQLIYANKTKADILLWEALEDKKFVDEGTLTNVTHVLSQERDPGKNQQLNPGTFIFESRIDSFILCKILPTLSDSTLILLCGPDAMVDSIRNLLISKDFGYKEQNVQVF